jgi:hypothetical protein
VPASYPTSIGTGLIRQSPYESFVQGLKGSSSHLLDPQPDQQGRKLFGVIVIIVLITIRIFSVTVGLTDMVVTSVVLIGDQRRPRRQHAVGDRHDRVVLAELEKCPGPATVLGWCSPSASDAHRVPTPRVERQNLLEPHVVLPVIDEAVLVQEALSDALAEISQLHMARVDEAFHAVHTPVDDEAMQMLAAQPPKGYLPAPGATRRWCCRYERAGVARSAG